MSDSERSGLESREETTYYGRWMCAPCNRLYGWKVAAETILTCPQCGGRLHKWYIDEQAQEN